MFQLREILFDKLDSFSSPYSDDQNLLKNNAPFDFESICLQENNFRDTDTTTWISKHVQISVSISLNLIEQPIFLCNSNPGALVESFVDAVDELATQGKVQMKLKFLEAENSVNSKLDQNFSSLNQRRVAWKQYWNLKMGVAKKKKRNMGPDSFYKHKSINVWICRIAWE